MSIRVLVVDDHPSIRDGLRFLINAQEDMEVVGEAADGTAAVEEVGILDPDVVIMDVELPGANGIEVARRIVAEHPARRVVMLSAFPDAAYVRDAVQAGARGYLLKGNAPNEVVQAVRAVVAGHMFMSPEATSALVSALKDLIAREGAKA